MSEDRLAELRARAAATYGIPEFAVDLRGSTYEELLAHAERLSRRIEPHATTYPSAEAALRAMRSSRARSRTVVAIREP